MGGGIAKEVLFERPQGTDGVLNWTRFMVYDENKRLASLQKELDTSRFT